MNDRGGFRWRWLVTGCAAGALIGYLATSRWTARSPAVARPPGGAWVACAPAVGGATARPWDPPRPADGTVVRELFGDALASGEPAGEANEARAETPAIALLQVRCEVARLQFVALAGEEPAWRVVLEDRASGEVCVVAPERECVPHGVAVERVDVELQETGGPTGERTMQRRARVEILDRRTGRRQWLTAGTTAYDEPTAAEVRWGGEAPRVVRPGETFLAGGDRYHVRRIAGDRIEFLRETAGRASAEVVVVARAANVDGSPPP